MCIHISIYTHINISYIHIQIMHIQTPSCILQAKDRKLERTFSANILYRIHQNNTARSASATHLIQYYFLQTAYDCSALHRGLRVKEKTVTQRPGSAGRKPCDRGASLVANPASALRNELSVS